MPLRQMPVVGRMEQCGAGSLTIFRGSTTPRRVPPAVARGLSRLLLLRPRSVAVGGRDEEGSGVRESVGAPNARPTLSIEGRRSGVRLLDTVAGDFG